MTYEEKQRAVMRLNKRMRDIINKSGFNTQEFEYWQNRISGGVYRTIRTTEAYTSDDQQYSLISRKREHIEQYSDEDLKELEDRTRTWSQIKEKVQQSMRKQEVPGGSDNAYTGERNYNNSEINEFLKMRKTINSLVIAAVRQFSEPFFQRFVHAAPPAAGGGASPALLSGGGADSGCS